MYFILLRLTSSKEDDVIIEEILECEEKSPTENEAWTSMANFYDERELPLERAVICEKQEKGIYTFVIHESVSSTNASSLSQYINGPFHRLCLQLCQFMTRCRYKNGTSGASFMHCVNVIQPEIYLPECEAFQFHHNMPFVLETLSRILLMLLVASMHALVQHDTCGTKGRVITCVGLTTDFN